MRPESDRSASKPPPNARASRRVLVVVAACSAVAGAAVGAALTRSETPAPSPATASQGALPTPREAEDARVARLASLRARQLALQRDLDTRWDAVRAAEDAERGARAEVERLADRVARRREAAERTEGVRRAATSRAVAELRASLSSASPGEREFIQAQIRLLLGSGTVFGQEVESLDEAGAVNLLHELIENAEVAGFPRRASAFREILARRFESSDPGVSTVPGETEAADAARVHHEASVRALASARGALAGAKSALVPIEDQIAALGEKP